MVVNDILNIERLLALAKNIPGFDLGAAAFMTSWQLSMAYNGAGPDRWDPQLCERITSYISLFEPAVMVHDADFKVSDGTIQGLCDSARRCRHNTAAILRYNYPFWDLRMLTSSTYRAARAKAVICKAALDTAVSPVFCRDAWLEAYDAKIKKESSDE